MIVNIIKSQGKMLVAVCDDQILGKIFEENGAILDLSTPFYKGKKVSDEIAREIMSTSDNLNIVGEHAIMLAVKIQLLNKSHVRKIANIPYAQVAMQPD